MNLKKLFKKCIAFITICSFLVVSLDISFFNFISFAAERICYVVATGVNVRSGGSTSYDVLYQVNAGDYLTIKGQTNDSTGKVWYKIDKNGKEGFIRSDFVHFPKEYVYDASFEQKLNNQNFPEDYKDYLRLLYAEHPLWEFEAFHTGLDFEYAVAGENEGTRSLVSAGSISSYKSTEDGKYDWNTSKWPTFDGSAWVCASKDLIRYYMDPRNFLMEPYIYQFEKQTFDSSIHTLDGVNEMVKGTFLESTIQTTGIEDKLVNNYNSNIGTNNFQNASGMMPIGPGGTIYEGTSNNRQNSPTPFEEIGPGANIKNEAPYSAKGPVINGIDNNAPNPINPINPFGNTDENGNVVPILKNNDDIYSFSQTIYAPGVMPQNIVSPVGNVSENIVEESSYCFNYFDKGSHTYAELIFDACRQVGISPYVVVSLILQEQGVEGKSDIISGKKQGYENIYNFGNIGAYAADGKGAIENGLIYAATEGSYNRPWNSKEKGIYGVVDYYANSFIKKGQDTFYLKKWNIQGDNMFKHQYMTNVLGACSEGQILSSAYDDNMKNKKHIMKIPVFLNMPINRCEKPTKDGSPNNKLKEIVVEGYDLTPTFDKDTQNYTLVVPDGTKSIKISATKCDKKSTLSGIGNVTLSTAITTVVIRVMAENKDIREYTITVYTPNQVMNINNDVSQNGTYHNEEPLIVPSVGSNGIYGTFDAPVGNLVPSPPFSSNNSINGPADIIYGTLY